MVSTVRGVAADMSRGTEVSAAARPSSPGCAAWRAAALGRRIAPPLVATDSTLASAAVFTRKRPYSLMTMDSLQCPNCFASTCSTSPAAPLRQHRSGSNLPRRETVADVVRPKIRVHLKLRAAAMRRSTPLPIDIE